MSPGLIHGHWAWSKGMVDLYCLGAAYGDRRFKGHVRDLEGGNGVYWRGASKLWNSKRRAVLDLSNTTFFKLVAFAIVYSAFSKRLFFFRGGALLLGVGGICLTMTVTCRFLMLQRRAVVALKLSSTF